MFRSHLVGNWLQAGETGGPHNFPKQSVQYGQNLKFMTKNVWLDKIVNMVFKLLTKLCIFAYLHGGRL
jgi:hypothetical protein